MNSLRVSDIRKKFGDFFALDGIDLEIPEHACVAFLGPSGCGKTTLLRVIAGLTKPDEGKVEIGGRDVTNLPASQRRIGMVFQSLALFPHLSVAENITYAQRIRGLGRDERRQRAASLLEMVRLPGVEDRHVRQLSGGQRQRVAIARALATDPSMLLLDEPLSALDAKLREEMQVEIRQLQQRLGITTVIVTHDRREAMTMSDLIVVMAQGKIQQVGKPIDIYRRPANSFVADFIGAANIVPISITGECKVRFDQQELSVETIPAGLAPMAVMAIRPENIRLHPRMAKGSDLLVGKVVFVRDLGANLEVHVEIEGRKLIAESAARQRDLLNPGTEVCVELPPADIVVMAS